MHFVPHGRLEAALLIVSVSSENKTGSAAYYSLDCDNHIKSDKYASNGAVIYDWKGKPSCFAFVPFSFEFLNLPRRPVDSKSSSVAVNQKLVTKEYSHKTNFGCAKIAFRLILK